GESNAARASRTMPIGQRNQADLPNWVKRCAATITTAGSRRPSVANQPSSTNMAAITTAAARSVPVTSCAGVGQATALRGGRISVANVARALASTCRSHAARPDTRSPTPSAALTARPRSEAWLFLDDLPVLVVDELEALRQQPNAADHRAHNRRKRRGAHHVDEQAITRLIGLIDRLVHQRVVENEQLVVPPVADLVANLDVGRAIVHVVQIVQNPK